MSALYVTWAAEELRCDVMAQVEQGESNYVRHSPKHGAFGADTVDYEHRRESLLLCRRRLTLMRSESRPLIASREKDQRGEVDDGPGGGAS